MITDFSCDREGMKGMCSRESLCLANDSLGFLFDTSAEATGGDLTPTLCYEDRECVWMPSSVMDEGRLLRLCACACTHVCVCVCVCVCACVCVYQCVCV